MNILEWLHWLSGLIVLAESLNKLERAEIFSPSHTPRDQLVDALKALAWLLLALGAGGAVFSPLLLSLGAPPDVGTPLARLTHPTLAETLVLMGFAVLIIRTRVKEG